MHRLESGRLIMTAMLVLATYGSATAQTWNAATDLRANELDASKELSNPNGTRPEWRYGHRSTAAASALTLFASPGEHSNNVFGTNPNLQGWVTPGGSFGIPFVYVDVSQPAPTSLSLHPEGPGGARNFEVVRWSAPSAGEYFVSAFWTDADPRAGNPSADGGEAFFVRNGVADGGFSNANPASGLFPEGGTVTLSRLVVLTEAESLDFVTGPGPLSNFADSTSFNATITRVPEPGTIGLAGLLGLLALGSRRRAGAARHRRV